MKKKILTLFLAFAIMMTFMPSMAFADTIDSAQIDVTISGASPLCAISAYGGATIEDGKFEFYTNDEKQCYYSLSDSGWHHNDGSQMQEEPTSLYATDYDHVIVSGKVTPAVNDEFTPDTDVAITYNSEEATEASQDTPLATENQGQAGPENTGCFWLDGDGKINFSLYLIPPPAEAPVQATIENININCTLPKTEQEDLVIIPIESDSYSFGYSVYDAKGNPCDGFRFENGSYVIRFVFTATEYYCFLNDGATYIGNINGNPAGEYGDIYLDDQKTLIVEVPFKVGSENNGIKLSGIVKVIAAATGVTAVVAVIGNIVKNVHNAAMMQQAAFQAKMQQQMVQKQVTSIKTVLKGAGVVFSLASFGSSLGKLFQLNQFGFNPFGFR